MPKIAQIELAPGLHVPRIITGLWQVADQERNGVRLDPIIASDVLVAYAKAGLDAFDMADHYGTSELIAGRLFARLDKGEVRLSARPKAFTKWCPPPGPMTGEIVRKGVGERLERLGAGNIALLQFHWWLFEHPAYLDALKEMAAMRKEGAFDHLGVTNVDTDHLALMVRHGLPIATNQVSFSLIDRRAAGRMSEFCLANDVKLLAYGTLCGGFLTDRWLGKSEPDAAAIPDWSKSKYKRFIDASGGWNALQTVLRAARAVADKHKVSIANVATRWVLEQPAVGAVIVGARLGEGMHADDNAATFGFSLDAADHAQLNEAFAATRMIPGDCGDEYRRPPFLTASGDLSHHLDRLAPVWQPEPVPGRPGRLRIDTGSVWEPLAGYSRAIRVGNRILVSGTTATHGAGEVVCKGDPLGQTVYILDKIKASIRALGGDLADVVRTRVYLANADDWEPVCQVHGRYFGEIRPANTLLEIGRLVGDYLVEIDAEAVVD